MNKIVCKKFYFCSIKNFIDMNYILIVALEFVITIAGVACLVRYNERKS